MKNKSRNDVAELLGMSVQNIASYINRGSLPTKEIHYVKIADYFGVTVDDLLRVNLEKEGIPEHAKLSLVKEEVEKYKTAIKELKDDKKVLKDALREITNMKGKT